ncbi:MAG TPA: hypothetical protein VK133_02645 [Amoebophilaceae bacterium]|nr:hypothetical protein [Amoebophilaceae bacterium]
MYRTNAKVDHRRFRYNGLSTLYGTKTPSSCVRSEAFLTECRFSNAKKTFFIQHLFFDAQRLL